MEETFWYEEFTPPKQTITVVCENAKSKIIVSNFVLETDIYFSWFKRTMWKLFFGLKVENL